MIYLGRTLYLQNKHTHFICIDFLKVIIFIYILPQKQQ